MNPALNKSGLSVLEVMVGVAIMSVVAVVMMILAQNLGTSVQRGNIDAEADQVINSVQNILNQTGDPNATPPIPSVCDGAMRDPGGGNVKWDPINAPGTRGQVGSIVANGVQIASVGQVISPNLTIKNMYLREPDPTLIYGGISTIGEGQPVHSETTGLRAPGNPEFYDTVVAKLVIEFDIPNGVSGTSLPRRMADVVVAIGRTATPGVEFCFTNQPIMAAHKDCVNAATDKTLITPANDCKLPLDPDPKKKCVYNYHVQGFDQGGTPICVCNITCGTATITKYIWTRSSAVYASQPPCSPPTVDPAPLYNGIQCSPTAGAQECFDSYTKTNDGGCGPAEGLPAGECFTYKCMPAP